MVILNPLQANVISAVSEFSASEATHIIGRCDLEEILNTTAEIRDIGKSFVSGLDQIMTVVLSRFQDSEGCNHGFNGILLAGWGLFPNPILSELCFVLGSIGLKVYLEATGPDFLQDTTVIAPESVAGLVIRNGLILKNGERRDCFGMEALRMTVKAFVSQSCVREFSVFAWETVEDNVQLSSAVLNRTFTWCNFYSVVPWIGPQSALFDSSVDVVPFEPLSAFDWLKDSRVMKLHNLWKSKRPVSTRDSHYFTPPRARYFL
jgi:hypothetical protein